MKNLLQFEGSDKVALLAVFALVIAAAAMLVEVRGRISYGLPVEIDDMGISISLPDGKQWQSNEKWQHNGLNYIIGSQKKGLQGLPDTILTVKFDLFIFEIPPREYLDESFSQYGIVDRGQEINSDIKLDWVCYRVKQILRRGNRRFEEVISQVEAVAKLDNSRQIRITIASRQISDTVIKMIKSFAGQINYHPDASLQKGLDFRTQFINEYSTNSIAGQKYFIVNDTDNLPIGFRIEKYHPGSINDLSSTVISNYDMITADVSYTQSSTLNFTEDLTMFKINSSRETSQTGQQFIREIAYGDNILSMNSIGSFFSQSNQDPSLRISAKNTFLPEHIYFLLAERFCKTNSAPVTIDLLDMTGGIVPTKIEKVEDTSQGCVLKFTSFDGSSNVDIIHMDRLHNIIKIVNTSKNYEIWSARKEDIEKLFPMWYEVVEQAIK